MTCRPNQTRQANEVALALRLWCGERRGLCNLEVLGSWVCPSPSTDGSCRLGPDSLSLQNLLRSSSGLSSSQDWVQDRQHVGSWFQVSPGRNTSLGTRVSLKPWVEPLAHGPRALHARLESICGCQQLETVTVCSAAHPSASAYWVCSHKRDIGSQHLEERRPRGRGPALPGSLVQSDGVFYAETV